MSWKQEKHLYIYFGESYNNRQEGETDSAYFGQQNFSIFTSSSYYHETQQGNLAKIPIAVTGQSSHHSRIAAFTCTNAIVNELKKRILIASLL